MEAAKKGKMKYLTTAFFLEAHAVIRDIYSACVFVWKGRELTPAEVKAWNERHAETPPDWWTRPALSPLEVPTSHTITEEGSAGNIVGWAGEWVVDIPTKKQVTTQGIDNVLTPAEVAEMKAYRISPTQVGLNNLTLAARIKPHWQAGEKPGKIAVSVGCSESTAKHYCLAFKRANEL